MSLRLSCCTVEELASTIKLEIEQYIDTCTMMCSDTKEYPLKLSGYKSCARVYIHVP